MSTNTNIYGFIKKASLESSILTEAAQQAIMPALIGLAGGGALGYISGNRANPYIGQEDTRLRNALIGGLLGGLGVGGASTYMNYNGIGKDIINTIRSPRHASPAAINVLNRLQEEKNS